MEERLQPIERTNVSEADLYADLDSAIYERDRSEVALRSALGAQMERLETRVTPQKDLAFSGNDFVLVPGEEHDPGEIIGHFAAMEHGYGKRVVFCWQNTFDASFHELSGYTIIFQATAIPYNWLRRIAEHRHFESFLADFARHVRGEASSNHEHAQKMSAVTMRPTDSITKELTEVARELGYDRVLSMWSAAQAEANSDPDRAISLACSLVEDTGQHMLKTLGREPPARKTIKTIVGAVSDALGLDPAKQAEAPLKGLCGGLNTIAQSIGDLRSGHSEAHGKSPDVGSLGRSHAIFAVNAAGVLATFLMRRLAEHQRAQGSPL